ncbi:hypothetical protein [Halovenus halobia]|uniref:hypothetical protein n=1 Tax=Halovenus halobia TaxID=3396622 RepID=UPI003F57C879
MDRRPFLQIASVATLPLAAGCLSTGSDSADDDSPDEPAPTNETEDTSDEDSSDQPDSQPLFAESFSVTSQSGFLAINEAVETRTQARKAGYILSDGEADETISVQATVADDGSWESTDVAFPPIEASGIEAQIESPDGLSGVLTENRMTASGTLRVVIEFLDDEFSFEVNATTEQSNALTGETNFDAEPPTATLVDNEFVIENSASSSIINSQLDLPAEKPGTNWFELEVELTD